MDLRGNFTLCIHFPFGGVTDSTGIGRAWVALRRLRLR